MSTVITRQEPSIAGIGFFQAMAILLLLLTLIGFAPTFFLRPWFQTVPLPFRLHVHGFFSTVWIIVLVSQTLLVASGRLAWHRRMGLLASAMAGALVISGLAILYSLAAGYPDNGWVLAEASAVIWGNIASLTTFCIFVVTGIALRKNAQTHKRMMLLATLSIMGPPLARISKFEAFRVSDIMVINEAVYVLGGMLVLYALILIHDFRTLGRPHTTLLWGIPLQMGLLFAAALGVAGTEFGQRLVLTLSGSGP
jgi:hypothetical protein